MTLIDLINSKEKTKRFRFDGYTYHFENERFVDEFGDNITSNINYDLSNLNSEIVIIEEDNKIEKIKKVVCDSDLIDRNHFVIEYLAELKQKINEIIDKLNELGDKEQ